MDNNNKIKDIINEIYYINKKKSINSDDNINLKTIGAIINNFYGYSFVRTSVRNDKDKRNVYKIKSDIKWGSEYYPTLLHANNDFSEYIFQN